MCPRWATFYAIYSFTYAQFWSNCMYEYVLLILFLNDAISFIMLEKKIKQTKKKLNYRRFLHYNNIATEGAKENIYDGRPCLGLPGYFKK